MYCGLASPTTSCMGDKAWRNMPYKIVLRNFLKYAKHPKKGEKGGRRKKEEF